MSFMVNDLGLIFRSILEVYLIFGCCWGVGGEGAMLGGIML
jgi:hypothetical protein